MKKYINLLAALCLITIFSISCGKTSESADNVDLDLSTLSTIMAEAEFYSIMANSEDYIGKIIRVRGEFISLYISVIDRYYHYIAITRGDSCCPPEGLEIRLTGDMVTNDDYPINNTVIEVTGILSSNEESGINLIYLEIEEIVIFEE